MKTRIFLLYAVLVLVGCAHTGPSLAKKPIIHHSQEEFLVGTLSHRTWFLPADFQREIREKQNRLRDMGAPGDVVENFKTILPYTHGMQMQMEKDVENERYAYYYAGIILKEGVKVKVSRGGFTLTLRKNDKTIEVHDEGLLVWYWNGQNRNYLDTARGESVVKNSLQKPEKKKPVEVYIRLPHQFQGWTLVSMSLNTDNVQVVVR